MCYMVSRDDGWRMPDWLWERIEPLLPPPPSHPLGCHRARVPDRDAMDAILLVLRTGMQWNALNATGVCSSSSAHRRFQEWEQAGVFAEIWRQGLLEYDKIVGIDWAWLAADGAMTKAPLVQNTTSDVTSNEVSSSSVMAIPMLRSSEIRPRGLGRRVLRSSLLEALAYPHGVDRYVELVRPLLLARDVRAEVTAVRYQTAKSVTLTLRPNENWRGFRAGQFVGVSVEVDGVRLRRPYSPAGSQQAPDGALELTVSTHPEGRVSRHLRDHARTGMIVGLTQAQGDFVLPEERPSGCCSSAAAAPSRRSWRWCAPSVRRALRARSAS